MLQSYFYKEAENIINKHDSDSTQNDLEKYLKSNFKNEPLEVQKRIINEFFNYGPLHSLLNNQNISEIIINGPGNIVYEESGQFIKHTDNFYSQKTLDNFIYKLNFETQTQINLHTPHLNTNWKGFRVHIVTPPISSPACITLRRHSHNKWNFENLIAGGWANEEQISLLKKQINDHKNILIVGPTGSGKTTILNCCLQSIAELDRCVIIEDTDELICPNISSTKLLTRMEHSTDLTAYTQADLLKQSLRMRPNRIIVGEIRGGEAKDYLMALSTGHEGGLCSLHANHPKQALLRLEMLIQMGAPQWSLKAIRQLIQLSLDLIVTVNIKNGKRFLQSIDRINSLEDSGFILEPIFNINNENHFKLVNNYLD